VKNFGGNWLCTGADVSFDGTYWNARMTYLRSGDVNMPDVATDENKNIIWNTGRYTKEGVKTFLWDPEIYENAGEYAVKRNLVPTYNPNTTDNPGVQN